MIPFSQAYEALEWNGLGGWVHSWDGKHIYESVSQLKDGETYLEIGVAHGASLALASLAAKSSNVNILGLDVIDWQDRDHLIEKYLAEFGKKPIHGFINNQSKFEAKSWGLPISVLYIDGDHTYEGVIKDMLSWLVWVKPGGTILFDDYNDRTGVKLAVDEFLLHHQAFYDFQSDQEMFICKKK